MINSINIGYNITISRSVFIPRELSIGTFKLGDNFSILLLILLLIGLRNYFWGFFWCYNIGNNYR